MPKLLDPQMCERRRKRVAKRTRTTQRGGGICPANIGLARVCPGNLLAENAGISGNERAEPHGKVPQFFLGWRNRK